MKAPTNVTIADIPKRRSNQSIIAKKFTPPHLTPNSTERSINNKYYTRATIYIRAVNLERDGEQYGTYYQAVRSYREQGRVKQEVVHLGEHSTPQDAMQAWEQEIGELEATRPKQVQKLQAKLERLRELTHTD
jgi:hypothetical protein